MGTGPRISRQDFASVPRVRVSLLFEDPGSSFNIGAIIRLADAFMLERVYFTGSPRSMDSRKIKSTALGSRRWVPFEFVDSSAELIRAKRSEGYEIAAGELAGHSMDPREYVRRGPVLLVLGNESDGVTQAALELSDVVLEIPIGGMLNSLNVSTAAAILLFHLVGDEARRIRDTHAPAIPGGQP